MHAGLQVAEVGSHAQLIESGGLYAQMWSRQLDSFRSSPDLPYTASGSVIEALEEELHSNGNGTAGAAVAGGGGGRGALRKTESLQAYMLRRAETGKFDACGKGQVGEGWVGTIGPMHGWYIGKGF